MRITVTQEEEGMRADKLLTKHFDGAGRAGTKRLFAQNRVKSLLPNGKSRAVAKGDVVRDGQIIEVDVDETDARAVPDPDVPLVVLFETADLVVVDKPAGQPTAPIRPGERGSLANALLARYPEMSTCGFSLREPGLCHRLDTDTSGVVLAARSKRAWDCLVGGLRDDKLDKRYLLVCQTEMLPEQGTIDIPLAPHPKDRKRVLACLHPRDVARNNPRPATTSFVKVREHGELALVEAKATKAQRHQIRAHFAALGHPLVGDKLYGGNMSLGLNRHALHASKITWGGNEIVPAFVVMSPLPEALGSLVPEPVVESPAT